MPQTSMTAWLKPKRDAASNAKTKGEEEAQLDMTSTSGQPQAAAKTHGSDIIHDPDSQAPQGKHDELPSSQHEIPANAKFEAVSSLLLPDFKRLIQLLLPVPYSDRFYKEILSDPVTASITLAVLWHDKSTSTPELIAGVRGRLLERCLHQSDDSEVEQPCLYIAAIGTLAPYRRYGLASALLANILAVAIGRYSVRTVTAHVWEANSDARAWYAKLGFIEVAFEPVYYRRLKPMGAYVLMRKVRPTDLLGQLAMSFENT